jgi:hypothetical protein
VADAMPVQPERTGMLGREELHRRLGYHPATADTIPHYEETRARVLELACHWDETLPPGRELAEAQTCLQDAAMWANAAVACNLAPLVDPAGRQPNPLVVQQMAHDKGTRTLTVGIACPLDLSPAQLADAVRDEVLFRLEHRSAAERSDR